MLEVVLGSPGAPLPPEARAPMESRFGHDFSAVRIHADAPARSSAAAVSARAYTVGPHVVLGHSAPDLASTAGRRLLGHELAHVVQQSRGDVAGGIDSDPSLEAEARRAGDAAAMGMPFAIGRLAAAAGPAVLQRDAEGAGDMPDIGRNFPMLEQATSFIAQRLGLNETASRVVAASLEGSVSGFSHQWSMPGGTGEHLKKHVSEFSKSDVPGLGLGYVEGLVEGLVSPVTDLLSLKIVQEQFTEFADKLASSAISHAEALKSELVGLLMELAANSSDLNKAWQGLKAKSLELLVQLFLALQNSGGLAEKAIAGARSFGQGAGVSAAKSFESPWEAKKPEQERSAGQWVKALVDKPMTTVSEGWEKGRDYVLSSPWSKVGHKAGSTVGTVLIQVVLMFFTAGVGTLITQLAGKLGTVAKAGSTLGRTLGGIAEFLAGAGKAIAEVEQLLNALVEWMMKPLLPVLEPLLKPLAGVMDRLGKFFRKLLGIAEKDASQVATTAATKALGGAHPHVLEPHLPAPDPTAARPAPHAEPHAAPKTAADPHPAAREPHAATGPTAEPTAKAPEAHAEVSAKAASESHPQASELAPGKPAGEPEPSTPHLGSDAAHKPLTEPEPVGGGHHVRTTSDGFELCSPPPCPNLRLIYNDQLDASAELRREMERLEAMRRVAARQETIGKPDPAFAKRINREAAELQKKLEAARLAPKAPITAAAPANQPPALSTHAGGPAMPDKPFGIPAEAFDDMITAIERGEFKPEGKLLTDLNYYNNRKEAFEAMKNKHGPNVRSRPGKTPSGVAVNPNPAVQYSHMAPQSALRSLPQYDPGEMVTRGLSTGKGHPHTVFDQYWQRECATILKTGRKQMTAQELYDIVSEAAIKSGAFSPEEGASVAALVFHDLFFQLGLSPSQLVRVPGS